MACRIYERGNEGSHDRPVVFATLSAAPGTMQSHSQRRCPAVCFNEVNKKRRRGISRSSLLRHNNYLLPDLLQFFLRQFRFT